MQAGLDGHLDRARETMRQALREQTPENWQGGIMGERVQLIRIFPEVYSQLYSRLDVFGMNTQMAMETANFRAELAWTMGDRELETALADTILSVYGSGNVENTGMSSFLLAMAYSHLGLMEDFLRERERVLDSIPPDRFAYQGMAVLGQMAEAAVRVGAVDLALEDLEYLLSVPSRAHPEIIRQDPLWLSLAQHPKFMALVGANPETERRH